MGGSDQMSETVSFVICTERGSLERKSLLLCDSIRAFGGRFAQAPIYSYAPRPGHGVSAETQREFERLGVHHAEEPLNRRWSHYPLANKIVAAARTEEIAGTDRVVFLDSDKVFISEPTEIAGTGDFDLAVRPVDLKNIGISSFDDVEGAYWQGVYRRCGLGEVTERVTTTVDRETVMPYYNSGLVSVRRDRGLFARWLENFERVMAERVEPLHGLFFVEQSMLAASATAMGLSVRPLSPSYNYPIHLHNQMLPDLRIGRLEDAVTVHYHKVFDREMVEVWAHRLEGFEPGTPMFCWWLEGMRRRGIARGAAHAALARADLRLRLTVRTIRETLSRQVALSVTTLSPAVLGVLDPFIVNV
jgi:hypothetical protein